MEPVLCVRAIEKTFSGADGACPALAGISFDIAPREIVCLMGPSGCGKSTLLRIIAGLDYADRGSLHMATDNNGGTARTAMVFQEHALFPWLSVYDNIVYGLRLSAQRVPEDEVARRAEALLALTRLSGFSRSLPHQLSGGMKQRAAVARALAGEPPVVLMDEPFSALDPFTRRELEDEVLRIRSDLKTTFLIVSHNPEEAVYLADRIIVLSPRPARVAAEIPVRLPFPRNPADPAFLKIREEVTRAVLGAE
ncbi:MAG: sulfonate ABC transporter ATP-binding protein [Methanomicrobiales archaeon HGW-Methanomicrobiales-3]|jgi:ABC-type nitrate/sulfonate/bicarbonate transport system ATPase subunit|nr:MAG: sulfonate ABC transporter ATP-binding protein [Methanomicrobiales archaeon HGW-Methanomicrobiales-3]